MTNLKFFLLILALAAVKFTFAQNEMYLDSLNKAFNIAKTDTQKVLILRKLAYSYSDNNNTTKALEFANKALDLAIKSNNHYNIYRSYLALGIFYNNIGKISDALVNYTKALKYIDQEKSISDACFMYTRIAGLYTTLENYQKSYEYYDKAIALVSPTKDSLLKLQIMLPKLTTYVNDKKFNEARKLLTYIDQVGSRNYKEWNQFQKLYYYEQFWLIEINDKKYDKALEYAEKELELAQKTEQFPFIINAKSLFGKTYIETNKYDKAKSYISEVIEGCIKLKDFVQLTEHYIIYGDIMMHENNFKEAKASLIKALELSKTGAIITSEIEAYKKLSLVTEKLNDPLSALNYYKHATILEDSINNNISQNIISEIQTRSESEQKQKEIELLNKDKKIASSKLEKEKTQRLALYGGLAVLITFGGFMYNRFRVTNKQKNIIEAQKELVEVQKHLVEEKHKEISDSINYAERIQKSFLATKDMLDSYLKDYFILFKPKDVVSGDFYWAEALTNGNFVLVTADSTGHGVPGAIMSLLNITSLERSIEQYTDPSDILNETRKIIIQRLKRDGSADGGKDGMDCSLIVFDNKNMKLYVAAAHNPVWIVRSSSPSITSGSDSPVTEALEVTVIEIKPDKMPVGKHERDKESFTTQSIDLKQGDVIYTLTDGFPDQFGGEKGKKFMSKNLRELLAGNAHLSMTQQRELLENTFTKWIGNLEQIDDVTVIGVRV